MATGNGPGERARAQTTMTTANEILNGHIIYTRYVRVRVRATYAAGTSAESKVSKRGQNDNGTRRTAVAEDSGAYGSRSTASALAGRDGQNRNCMLPTITKVRAKKRREKRDYCRRHGPTSLHVSNVAAVRVRV